MHDDRRRRRRRGRARRPPPAEGGESRTRGVRPPRRSGGGRSSDRDDRTPGRTRARHAPTLAAWSSSRALRAALRHRFAPTPAPQRGVDDGARRVDDDAATRLTDGIPQRPGLSRPGLRSPGPGMGFVAGAPGCGAPASGAVAPTTAPTADKPVAALTWAAPSRSTRAAVSSNRGRPSPPTRSSWRSRRSRIAGSNQDVEALSGRHGGIDRGAGGRPRRGRGSPSWRPPRGRCPAAGVRPRSAAAVEPMSPRFTSPITRMPRRRASARTAA